MRNGWILLAIGLAACDVVDPGSDDSTLVIRGVVRAPAEGTARTGGGPVGGMRVWITSGPSLLGPERTHASTTTSVDGTFELRMDASGPASACTFYQIRGEGVGHWIESVQGFDNKQCVPGTIQGVIVTARLLVQPESTLTFVSRPSNTQEECVARPAGTVCMGFVDDYVWLVEYPSPVRGNRSGGLHQGHEVSVYMFDGLELHHVLWTDLVAEVRW